MKTIRMLTDEVGGDDEFLSAGEEYSLADASADHWLKRKKAVEVGGAKAKKAAASKAAEDAEAARKKLADDLAAKELASKEQARAANTAAAASPVKPEVTKPADGGATVGKPTSI